MDLLELIGSDDDNDDSDESRQDDKEHRQENRFLHGEIAIPSNNEMPSTKRQKRGSIEIVSSSQVPPDQFVRSVPYRRGYWSGHVKIPCNNDHPFVDLAGTIQQAVHQIQQTLEVAGVSGLLVRHEDLHFSLSRPVSLQLACLESFVQTLQSLIQYERSTCLMVDTSNILVLVNDERTRTFFGWSVQPNPTLLRIIGHVNRTLRNYNQPAYYDPPIFHISIASMVGDVADLWKQTKTLKNNVPPPKDDDDDNDDDDDDDDTIEPRWIRLEQIHCSFGNKKEYIIGLCPDS